MTIRRRFPATQRPRSAGLAICPTRQHNLYGVDLNAEAIQICQLRLSIKTAARGKRLTSLDHTIREGNSIISEPAVHPKALDWQAAFPEVFAQGGVSNVVPVECWSGAGQ
jgi:hypothetical protein